MDAGALSGKDGLTQRDPVERRIPYFEYPERLDQIFSGIFGKNSLMRTSEPNFDLFDGVYPERSRRTQGGLWNLEPKLQRFERSEAIERLERFEQMLWDDLTFFSAVE